MEIFVLVFLLLLFLALFRLFGNEGDQYGYYNKPRGKKGVHKPNMRDRSF